jgi:hypothetical protein
MRVKLITVDLQVIFSQLPAGSRKGIVKIGAKRQTVLFHRASFVKVIPISSSDCLGVAPSPSQTIRVSTC